MSSHESPPPFDVSQRTLTEKTARGFVYLLMQSVGNLTLGVGLQIILAQLLSKSDFGIYAMAVAFNGVAIVIQFGGVREVLIARHQAYRRWANAAFWLSTSIGLIVGCVVAALAPVAAWWFKEPRVIPLVLLMALVIPVGSAGVVGEARLRGQLRFRAVAAIDFAWFAILISLTIVFAALGKGPLSFVLPRLIADPARLVVVLLLTRPPVRFAPQFRRWKFLIGDSTRAIVASLVELGVEIGDYLVLGRYHPSDTVGIYYFAYSVSRKPMAVFYKCVGGVLFPALATLQTESKRQVDAFLRAMRVQALMAVPVCAVVIAIADPAFRAALPEKWFPSIPVLQIVCAGMLFRITGWSCRSLLKAQGRFRTYLGLQAVYTALFIAAAWVASVRAPENEAPVWLAVAVVCVFAVMEPIFAYQTVHPGGGRMRDLVAVHFRPLIITALAVGPAWLVSRLVPEWPAQHWIRLFTILLITMVMYPTLTRWIAPDLWNEVKERVRGFLRTR